MIRRQPRSAGGWASVALAACALVALAGCGEASPFIKARTAGGAQGGQVTVNVDKWNHWQGRNFSALRPTPEWAATESNNGVDVRSPGGKEGVSYALVSNGFVPYNPQFVIQSLANTVGLQNFNGQIISGPTQNASGTTETVAFTAFHATLGALKGTMKVTTTSSGAGYGYEAALEYAPSSEWDADHAVLDAIAAHVTRSTGVGE